VKGENNSKAESQGTIQKLTRLLAAPTIEPSQRAARIQTVEKDIVLPLRALILGILTYYIFFSGWLDTTSAARISNAGAPRHYATNTSRIDSANAARVPRLPASSPDAYVAPVDDWSISHEVSIKTCFLIYAALNIVAGLILIWVPHLTLKKIEAMAFVVGVLDAALMAALTLLSKGFDSTLYLVFPVLILHNALAIPVALLQLLLNFIVSAGFFVGGLFDLKLIFVPGIDERTEKPIERLTVLVAWALCCYGIQLLFEKQKLAEAEAMEFAVRQERLHTAGRLAAEIAHQIKNPLGIITNAAFSLQRAVHDGEFAVDEQVQIIREEVERADQIITELMGYAQLAEGRVERLEVADELDNALLEVFPPAAKYRVDVVKHYQPGLPALLMQKRHLSSVLVNLMQNAREAMHGVGKIEVDARFGEADSVIIKISDNGSGIPPDKLDKIFDAYFTTRDKGTGLGLAIVKHNTEMYGGAVTVQSELGQGTRFTLEFPSRILLRLSK